MVPAFESLPVVGAFQNAPHKYTVPKLRDHFLRLHENLRRTIDLLGRVDVSKDSSFGTSAVIAISVEIVAVYRIEV